MTRVRTAWGRLPEAVKVVIIVELSQLALAIPLLPIALPIAHKIMGH